jgi:transcriptional regulator with PAS, ATPase and Fis domain
MHKNSLRTNETFQAVNCAAINENLLESELFGHEKGAFTGAVGEKKGLFEIANNGTLFLDEIGELDIALQAKLLRALQEREIRRVGGVKEIPVDVRVLAATNRDLLKMTEEKRFREDLYYRLNVLSIEIPPLRERRSDIPGFDRILRQETYTRHRPEHRDRVCRAKTPHRLPLSGKCPAARIGDRTRDPFERKRHDHHRRPPAGNDARYEPCKCGWRHSI